MFALKQCPNLWGGGGPPNVGHGKHQALNTPGLTIKALPSSGLSIIRFVKPRHYSKNKEAWKTNTKLP